MIGKIITVGGYTLVSRVTGFLRDIMLAAIIGAGPVADAFFVAFRLPNHFRAIFAEGAFNAAFIPAYARIRTEDGARAANDFGDRIFTLLFLSQVVLLALALAFTPQVIELLAPGFSREPQQFALAVSLTRITFPYLLLITLVTLWSGILNALHRFAAAAAAPILLNITMMATLALAYWFPSAGHAAAWGVLISGVLQVFLVAGDSLYARVMTSFRVPRWDKDVRRFFKALLPATLGSAGTQLALFADTIIASFLSAGAISALYYADRIDQLPIGVIGIAVGTVLVPEMTQRLALGDDIGARAAQNRAIEFALLLARLIHARRLHRGGCRRRGIDTRGLYDRARSVHSHSQHRGAVSRARRYCNAGQGGVDRHRGQHTLQDRADVSTCSSRTGARNVYRRLAQLCPRDLFCLSGALYRTRCRTKAVPYQAGRRRARARSRFGSRRAICHFPVIFIVQVPRRIRIGGFDALRRCGLWRADHSPVR
jgi:putative peptidoglycan lipid II flippase